MSVGFVMLAHSALNRSAEVARIIAEEDCPLVIHIDQRVGKAEFDRFATKVAGLPRVTLADRRKCDWGTWSLVDASRNSAARLLSENPDVSHVMLISGGCLPIKPIADLKCYLAGHKGKDFIESVTIEDVPWTQGGLSEERFLFSFPFAWKRQRRLFDLWVDVQRRLGRKRPIPAGLQPHLGSQWWCLSRATLERILDDPARDRLDRYFRKVWIPDESYFQTLVRRHGARVESRSLTLSRFDFQGKPHVFYDDHLNLLLDTPAFFARKIWPGAQRLYDAFLCEKPVGRTLATPVPGVYADRLFGEAVAQRTSGRPGLAMAGRFPRQGFENGLTAGPYAVFHGLGDVLQGFPQWISGMTGSRTHGHLFARDKVEYEDGADVYAGALSDSAALRDYDPESFLRNLVWNTRGEHQSFLFSPRDSQDIGDFLARDRNASVFVVTGAWALPLLRAGLPVAEARTEAARLQRLETRFVNRLKERRSLAQSRIWTLADLLERPSDLMQQVLDDMSGAEARTLKDRPGFQVLEGLPGFLQTLRNAGMNPHVAGELGDLPIPLPRDAAPNVVRLR